MRVEEVLFEDTFQVNSPMPYYDSVEVLHYFSDLGKVIERSNDYATDGPTHRSSVYFDFIAPLDHFSHLVFSFFLDGEAAEGRSTLSFHVTCTLVTSVEETSFFSSTFTRYYLDRVFPVIRTSAEKQLALYKSHIIRQRTALSKSHRTPVQPHAGT